MGNQPETPATKSYLDLFAAQLRSLPPDARAEQREEVRLHLLAMTAACREPGAGAEAAEREALGRFGDPVRLGRSIARRYWPPGVLSGSFALAFGTALVWLIALYGTISGVLFLLDNWYISTGADTSSLHNSAVMAFLGMSLFFFVVPALAGWLTALAAPRHAAPAMLAAVPAVLLGSWAATTIPAGTHTDFWLIAVPAIIGGLAAHRTSRSLQRQPLSPGRRLLAVQGRKR